MARNTIDSTRNIIERWFLGGTSLRTFRMDSYQLGTFIVGKPNATGCTLPVLLANSRTILNEYGDFGKIAFGVAIAESMTAHTIKTFVDIWNRYNSGFVKVLFRGNVFYVGYGIVLDKRFNPLIVVTADVSRCYKSNNSSPYFWFENLTVNISNDIFSKPEYLALRSWVVKTFIPTCSNTRIRRGFTMNGCSEEHRKDLMPIYIRFGTTDGFVMKVKTPSVTEDLSAEMADLIDVYVGDLNYIVV